MRKSRTLIALALAAVSVVLVTGCAQGSGGGAARTGARPTASAHPTDPAAAYADARLATMTVRQKVASLFMLHAPGTDPVALREFVQRNGLGGLILLKDNVPATPALLAAETAGIDASDPQLPPLIAVDEEGGDVTRLPWDAAPGAQVLRTQPPAAAAAAFAQHAAALKQAGISVNFGTVADVTADPHSFIADRVLGTDPLGTSQRVAASVQGERGTVLSTLKHFPGHGETQADSHLVVPMTTVDAAHWRQQDAPSFRAGIAAGAELVMFGHLTYSSIDATPASLSPRWHSILRDELGFHGVTITDDLRMLQDTGLPEYADASADAIQAIAAGNTMVLDIQGAQEDPAVVIDAVTEAVEQGRIPEQVIDADARKLLESRHALVAK